MLEYLKKESNITYTENGAVTNASTYSNCLDLFATIGAIRNAENDEIIKLFMRAYAENPDLAMKLLFFARDVRGGLGERRVFRTILEYLAVNNPNSVRKNIAFIPELGRFDDLMVLIGTPCQKDAIDFIKKQLDNDLIALKNEKEVSLLAKWLPSVNATNAVTVKNAKIIARAMGMNDVSYRKTLSRLRAYLRLIENNLRECDYTFDYSKQPSKAMYKYRKAFLRNDGERYRTFMKRVLNGETELLHTGTLTPYEIIAPFFGNHITNEERQSIDVTWRAQEDFTDGENALVVVDGSGSMYGSSRPMPIIVALSLGIYFAERNKGTFHNHFITFSEKPQLVRIKGNDIFDKVNYCHSYNEMANTNIQKVFELILKTALKYHVPQNEMPSTLYFISDMEFDSCTKDAKISNFEYAKKLFARYNYKLPRVVFWNVRSRTRQQPVTQNEQGVALVSGCTPQIFSMLQNGTLTSPYNFMLNVLSKERYAKITA